MKFVVPLVTLAAVLSAQPAPRVVVFAFTVVGVDEASGKVATSIFRTELGNTGKFTVIEADVIKAALGNDDPIEGVAVAAENARKVGAEKAVIGSLSKLGEQTLVEVKLIDVALGTVEFNDRLGTASGSDVDVILSRLAKGVAERKKAERTAEVGKVTEKESEEPARRSSFWSAGGRIGCFFPLGGFGSNPGLPLGFSGCGLYETPGFMAEAAWDFYGILGTGGQAGLWRAGFSGFALTSKTDICPYWGGGIGLGAVQTGSGGSGVGPIVNLGGGVMFLRTYDFRIVADLRYYLSFCGEAVSPLQHGPAISVGLLYKRSKTEGSRGGCCGGGLFGF